MIEKGFWEEIDNHCVSCGKETNKFRPNPYRLEIYNDSTEKYICDSCYRELLHEI